METGLDIQTNGNIGEYLCKILNWKIDITS